MISIHHNDECEDHKPMLGDNNAIKDVRGNKHKRIAIEIKSWGNAFPAPLIKL